MPHFFPTNGKQMKSGIVGISRILFLIKHVHHNVTEHMEMRSAPEVAGNSTTFSSIPKLSATCNNKDFSMREERGVLSIRTAAKAGRRGRGGHIGNA